LALDGRNSDGNAPAGLPIRENARGLYCIRRARRHRPVSRYPTAGGHVEAASTAKGAGRSMTGFWQMRKGAFRA
jgi:hypothetical protein